VRLCDSQPGITAFHSSEEQLDLPSPSGALTDGACPEAYSATTRGRSAVGSGMRVMIKVTAIGVSALRGSSS